MPQAKKDLAAADPSLPVAEEAEEGSNAQMTQEQLWKDFLAKKLFSRISETNPGNAAMIIGIFLDELDIATFVRGVELLGWPQVGADDIWTDMVAAYELMTEDEQKDVVKYMLPSDTSDPMTEEQKKSLFGRLLFSRISKIDEDGLLDARKITGMLLEMDNVEILSMLRSAQLLNDRVAAAAQVLPRLDDDLSLAEEVFESESVDRMNAYKRQDRIRHHVERLVEEGRMDEAQEACLLANALISFAVAS